MRIAAIRTLLPIVIVASILVMTPARMTASHARVSDGGGARLNPGDNLFPGDALNSADGRLRLQYQGDGNLVLLDTATDPWTPLWSTGTNDGNPGIASFQPDGNFVVYNGDGDPVWSSGTFGTSGDYYLFVQDDGNMVIYQNGSEAVWATNTFFGAPSARRH